MSKGINSRLTDERQRSVMEKINKSVRRSLLDHIEEEIDDYSWRSNIWYILYEEIKQRIGS